MSHEIVGIIGLSVIVFFFAWLSSSGWSILNILKRRKTGNIKNLWLLVSLLPIVGGALYYFKGYDVGDIKSKAYGFLKKTWPVIAVILIIYLGFYTRLLNYDWPYLRNIDSYVFYRWIDEIVQNNGILPVHDIYQLSPDGFYRPPQWIYPYFYIGAYSYIITNTFVPGINLMDFLIYLPAFLAVLAAIPVYFIGKLLFNRKAGILAAFFYVFDISNFSRSLGGDPDSDAIVILMSMLAIWAFLGAYKVAEVTKKLSKRVLFYSVISALVLWIWYSTWAGYWYVFWLISGFILLRLIFGIISKNNSNKTAELKTILVSFIIIVSLSFILTIPSYGDIKITSALFGPIQFQSIKGEESFFPNVYVSVAELQSAGEWIEIIKRTSVLDGAGLLVSPFFLMVYSLIGLIFFYIKTRKYLDSVLFIMIWFLGPFASTIMGGVRFSILFSAPLAVGSGIFLSMLIGIVFKKLGEDYD